MEHVIASIVISHLLAGCVAFGVVWSTNPKFIKYETGINKAIMSGAVIVGGFYSLAVLKLKGKF